MVARHRDAKGLLYMESLSCAFLANLASVGHCMCAGTDVIYLSIYLVIRHPLKMGF